MGTIFGEDKTNSFGMGGDDDDDDEDSLIDMDDRLYFPVNEKVVDISKNIRDLIHIEITLNAACEPKCRGTNLNSSKSTSRASDAEEKGVGPFGNLRQQMQQT